MPGSLLAPQIPGNGNRATHYPLGLMNMRATWDALASAETEVYVGDPARGAEELAGLFGRLGADPHGGLCIEVGCGPGRMTAALAKRFDRVLAVDVSPAMVQRARASVTATNVDFRAVSGDRLDGVADGIADALVCYLVLQHLPTRRAVRAYLREFARVLAPSGEAFVQLPVLERGARPRLWRLLRTAAVPVLERLSRNPASARAFRGFRLTDAELGQGLEAAGLRVVAREAGPDAPYRHSRDVFLRLRRSHR
jgi:SAM-dependent methyltransferase